MYGSHISVLITGFDFEFFEIFYFWLRVFSAFRQTSQHWDETLFLPSVFHLIISVFSQKKALNPRDTIISH